VISRLLYLLIAGGLGGLLGWLVSEPFSPAEILPHGVDPTAPEWADLYRRSLFHQNLLGGATGMFVGALVAGASGWAVGSLHHLRRGLLWGAVAGLLAGGVSVHFAAGVYDTMMRPYAASRAYMVAPLVALTARAIGWGVFGCLLGAGQAIATRSWPRVRQAAIGGLLGGAIGGVLFEITAPIFQPISQQLEPGRMEVGRFSRAVGLVCVGAGIGMFIGLVEFLMRSAWIRVLQGRNEGKEYLVDARRTVIGRSETADIPLFGDPAVAPQHVAIDRVGRDYVLVDSGAGTLVNGMPVQSVTLRDGDALQIGRFVLQFRLKAGQGVRAPVDVKKPTQAAVSMTPPNVCQFCGQTKDAAGNCACTPVPRVQPATPVTAAGVQANTLVAWDGPLAGSRFVVGPAPVGIGRDPSNAIALTGDAQVSRRHARAQIEGGNLVIYDEGSTNGTFVNGVRITQQVLSPGDVVTVGQTSFRVE
jgi:pSer/pThr/pTyr-binding forkhead associated (FHA) protein